jgi:hypothetical protein
MCRQSGKASPIDCAGVSPVRCRRTTSVSLSAARSRRAFLKSKEGSAFRSWLRSLLPGQEENGNPAIADTLSRPRAESNPQTPQHGALSSQAIRALRSGHRAEGACVTPLILHEGLLGIPDSILRMAWCWISPNSRCTPKLSGEEPRMLTAGPAGSSQMREPAGREHHGRREDIDQSGECRERGGGADALPPARALTRGHQAGP